MYVKSNQWSLGHQPQGATQELEVIDSTICNTGCPRSPRALAESQQTEGAQPREVELVFTDRVVPRHSFHRLEDSHVVLPACQRDWAMLSSRLPRRSRNIMGKYRVVYTTVNHSGHQINIPLFFPSIKHTHPLQFHHLSILGRQL